MSIKIVCEECGTKKKVNERFAGRRIKCPQCESVIRVPDAPVASEPEVEVVPPIPSGEQVPLGEQAPSDERVTKREDDNADDWDQAIKTGSGILTPAVDADSGGDAPMVDQVEIAETVAVASDPVVENQVAEIEAAANQSAAGQSAAGQSKVASSSAAASVAAAIAATQPSISATGSVGGATDEASDDDDDDDDDDDGEVLARTKRPEEEMDMTPMVDVTFLLLIFFMVTAAFSLQKSIEMPRQQTEAPSTTNTEPEEDTEMVDIEVDENGSFLVLTNDWERETPGKQNLIAALRDANAGKNEPMKLNVKVHESAKVKAMVDAMDAGTIADYSPILITQVDGFD